MESIQIKTDMIQLDQLLKLGSILQSGGEIRFLLEEKRIFVNGILCEAKRKKIHVGDVVEIKGVGTYTVTRA
ncbi:RNA-binding S4 domain-containing protein [uncultured Megasphaera sp.]|uniref:RNA-binding S4 domain-containing protein n=1 Tax=uncultured Megasphaera sp. TaxID=165188 RepID=UPI002658016F|nr:RNA-binding S4 domain-containing protein [uncultured Megasphaera sp.]